MVSYLDDYTVPGTQFRVASNQMLDPSDTRMVLDWVLRKCGREAAAMCALEMKRRREERAAMVRTFLLVNAATSNVDTALAAVLNADGR